MKEIDRDLEILSKTHTVTTMHGKMYRNFLALSIKYENEMLGKGKIYNKNRDITK